jgi:hypothetical protein
MFRVEVTTKYFVDGHEVSLDQYVDNLGVQAVAAAAEELADRLRNLRCPDHGDAPAVLVHLAGSEADMRTESCCQTLAALVRQRLEAAG